MLGRITLRVQRDGRPVTVTVTADGGEQTVNHAGAALLAEAADRLGLTGALSGGLAGLRERRAGHDPGQVIRDLAVMLADGGDALCDLRTLRDQGALFGKVASDATAWRVIDAVCERGLLDAIGAARAAMRARVFALGVRPAGPLVIDLDATLIGAHSDKDGAAGTYKGGFGFHPLLAYLDCPDSPAGGMALAGRLRPGNAGANDAHDHIAVLGDALQQLPRGVVETETIAPALSVRTTDARAPGLLPRRAPALHGRLRSHRARPPGHSRPARRRLDARA
jgi:DDE family transposase